MYTGRDGYPFIYDGYPARPIEMLHTPRILSSGVVEWNQSQREKSKYFPAQEYKGV